MPKSDKRVLSEDERMNKKLFVSSLVLFIISLIALVFSSLLSGTIRSAKPDEGESSQGLAYVFLILVTIVPLMISVLTSIITSIIGISINASILKRKVEEKKIYAIITLVIMALAIISNIIIVCFSFK